MCRGRRRRRRQGRLRRSQRLAACDAGPSGPTISCPVSTDACLERPGEWWASVLINADTSTNAAHATSLHAPLSNGGYGTGSIVLYILNCVRVGRSKGRHQRAQARRLIRRGRHRLRGPGRVGRSRLEAFRAGGAIPAFGQIDDGPRARRGVHTKRIRRWRKDPHHQREAGESQGKGRLHERLGGLTSRTFPRSRTSSCGRCVVLAAHRSATQPAD